MALIISHKRTNMPTQKGALVREHQVTQSVKGGKAYQLFRPRRKDPFTSYISHPFIASHTSHHAVIKCVGFLLMPLQIAIIYFPFLLTSDSSKWQNVIKKKQKFDSALIKDIFQIFRSINDLNWEPTFDIVVKIHSFYIWDHEFETHKIKKSFIV